MHPSFRLRCSLNGQWSQTSQPFLFGSSACRSNPMPQPAWVAGRLQKESFYSRFLYNTVLKRSSTYMTAVMVTATVTGALRAASDARCVRCTAVVKRMEMSVHRVYHGRHRLRLRDERDLEHQKQRGASTA